MKNDKRITVGPVQFVCQRRERGFVIRVYVSDGGAQQEALKLDALQYNPHYHLDPQGRNRVYPIPDAAPLRWVFDQIAENLSRLLYEAGYAKAATLVDQDAVRTNIAQIKAALVYSRPSLDPCRLCS